MDKDKRKLRRRPIRYTASVAFGPGDMHTCVVSDISEAGARIDMEQAESAPEQFVLFLSHNGAARRLCKVVWRKPRQVGVKFEPHLAVAGRAAPMPHPPVDADAAESEKAAHAEAESTNVG